MCVCHTRKYSIPYTVITVLYWTRTAYLLYLTVAYTPFPGFWTSGGIAQPAPDLSQILRPSAIFGTVCSAVAFPPVLVFLSLLMSGKCWQAGTKSVLLPPGKSWMKILDLKYCNKQGSKTWFAMFTVGVKACTVCVRLGSWTGSG